MNAPPDVTWHVAMRPCKRAALDKSKALGAMLIEGERLKVRYRGLKKNTAQLTSLFALSSLWMARGKLLADHA